VEQVSMVLSVLLMDDSSDRDEFEAVLNDVGGGQKRESTEVSEVAMSGVLSSVINAEGSNISFRAMIRSIMSFSSCRCMRRCCRRAMHRRHRDAFFRLLFLR